jgi:hypothetical protein
MSDRHAERERAMRELAARLFFTVERRGFRYDLHRDLDGEEPVHRDGLTLDEAEELLSTWKMHGAHGG